jgi:AraC family transcriptional activator FtrA
MPSAVHDIVMVVSAGMPMFEVAVPCELFGMDRSELVSPWYRFSVVGVGDGPVPLAGGFGLLSGADRDMIDRADTLIVPACVNVHEDQPAELVDLVRNAYRRGVRIVSFCSGAFVLAAAGVLDGRTATTHWKYAEELATRFPAVRVNASVLYVEDGNVITSAGTAAGIDACLHLVRTDHGSAVAAEVARRLVIPPHRDGGQAQYYQVPGDRVDDDWLGSLLDWVRGNVHQQLTMTDLAARAGVSVRTLERRFAASVRMTPLRWLLTERVRRAQQLLEATDLPVDRISGHCGFGTPASLRAHFVRIVGVSPIAYRRTFHAPA